MESYLIAGEAIELLSNSNYGSDAGQAFELIGDTQQRICYAREYYVRKWTPCQT